jgi:outer membrane protein TolC
MFFSFFSRLWGGGYSPFLMVILISAVCTPCYWGTVLAETKPGHEGSVLTLDVAITKALAGNPGLGEIKARAEALAAIPEQAGALPDPTINVGLLNVPTNSFNLHQEDMTMMEMGISQTIPFPGKRALREKVAEHEAMASAESVEEARLRLTRDVKLNWWRLFYYDRTLKLLSDSEGFFQQLIDIAQANYKVGKGAQQEVMMAQLELSKLKSETFDFMGQRGTESAKLNALLDRDVDTPLMIPAETAFKLPELVGTKLQNKALLARPLFAQHGRMLEAAKAKVELAQSDFYPDFTVGGGYAFRQNTPTGQGRSDFASVQLSMNVPIYANHKQAKAVDQRKSELLQEQYALKDEHHKIQAEIEAKTSEYQQTRKKLLLLEHEILPQAQQAVDSLLSGYQVSQKGFSDLLRTQLSYFQYQIQYWQALTNTQQILAELSAEVGEELSHE